jgi:hypothetical protein
MGHVAAPIAELTARAQTLTSAGDLAGARDVLAPVLGPADADPQHASADLALAAALHARILIALGDPHAARTWAGFAHAAEERLHGPHDERTIAAAATHAAVLGQVGNHGRAAQLYHDLVLELTARDGRESPRVLAAEADLATAEHAAGQCTAARSRLAEAWSRHRRVHGDAVPAGIKMLARLGAMERECGRHADAERRLSLAQELCARYLPDDHPLVAQVARLAAAPASGRHVCGRVRRSGGPDAEADTGPAPGVRSVADTAGPGARRVAPGVEALERSPRDAAPPDPGPEPMPPPDNRSTDPQGATYQQPLYLSDLRQSPGEAAGRHARADTPLPVPGQRPPEYTPDGRRVPIGSAPVTDPDDPAGAGRRLPVPVDRTRPASSRAPFVLAAVLVAGIGVAAAVVAATLPRGETAAPPAAAPSASAAAPSSAAVPSSPAASATADPATAGAPAGVRLRDNRDSVTLTWTYPKGSEGPVLISGGRRGEPQRAFQQLPAGSADYVVYGLNEQLDYCFTVAVVQGTDRVAASPAVCTARR